MSEPKPTQADIETAKEICKRVVTLNRCAAIIARRMAPERDLLRELITHVELYCASSPIALDCARRARELLKG